MLLDDGRASFQALQQGHRAGLVYLAFDLLELDGAPLLAQPLDARKARLRALIGPAAGRIRYSDHVVGHGQAFFDAGDEARRRGHRLEAARRGVSAGTALRVVEDQVPAHAAVRRRRLHRPGRHDRWTGRTARGLLRERPPHVRRPRRARGFAGKSGGELLQRLTPLARRPARSIPPPAGPLAKSAHFVEPSLVCLVAFAEWTGRRSDSSSGVPRAGAGRPGRRDARRLTC